MRLIRAEFCALAEVLLLSSEHNDLICLQDQLILVKFLPLDAMPCGKAQSVFQLLIRRSIQQFRPNLRLQSSKMLSPVLPNDKAFTDQHIICKLTFNLKAI